MKCDECHAGPSEHGYMYRCDCARCERETPDERFYTCANHQKQVDAKHERIRGYPARWLWTSRP